GITLSYGGCGRRLFAGWRGTTADEVRRATNADADDERGGDTEPLLLPKHRAQLHLVPACARKERRARRIECLTGDGVPHGVEGDVARIGRPVVRLRRVVHQLLESVAVLFGHDSYSFAKSESAARSWARAIDRRLLQVPSATPSDAAISGWV